MGCPTEVVIGDDLVFSVCTHDPDTGVLTDAGSAPAYRVYEDETGTAILTGSMAKLDDANTTGFYTELIACTAANGFENGKTYTLYIEATVDSDTGGICFGFKAVVAATGSGARTVTVTVDDGSDPLENARVRFSEAWGSGTYIGPTDVSGQVVLCLDDATYTVGISKGADYSFTPTTLVVDGAKNVTYSMSAVSIDAPPNASTITGVQTEYDEEGVVEEGVEVSVQILEGPGTDGIGYDSAVWTETSNGSGVVQFAGLLHGARYRIWRGDSKANAQTFTAPTSGDSFNLTEIIGRG